MLISHGESEAALRPDLVAGRSPEASLTARGERQARALAVFLKSRGVRFESVYTSPLDRARATALLVARVILHDQLHFFIFVAMVDLCNSLVLSVRISSSRSLLVAKFIPLGQFCYELVIV